MAAHSRTASRPALRPVPRTSPLSTMVLQPALPRAGVPPGVYYVRVRAVAAGCPPGAASNEIAVTVSGASAGNPFVTLTLAYTCNPCTGDPDNYALNVDCINGRCTIFRTSNATRSGTITATVRMAPGVHNVEVVSRPAHLDADGHRVSARQRRDDPRFMADPRSSGRRRIVAWSLWDDWQQPFEAFVEFTVSGGGSPSC